MGASKPISRVKLSKDDIIGAKFTSTNLSEPSLHELKRRLACPALPTPGNKAQLLER